MNTTSRAIIEKWYRKLNFPSKFDKEFYEALNTIEISESTSIEGYNLSESDGKRNLLSFLYMCEALEKKYQNMEIPESILIDTLEDLVRWTEIWSYLKKELYLGQLTWVSWHMNMKLFKIGRLQFAMQKTDYHMPQFGIKPKDDIIGIHIPSGEPMTPEACRKSLEEARVFFDRFYPEYKWEYFTCHTWLLDSTLGEILKPESNILKFRSLFDDVSHEEPSDALLGYVFKWQSTREEVKSITPTTSLAKKIQQRINENGVFHEAVGIIKKYLIQPYVLKNILKMRRETISLRIS